MEEARAMAREVLKRNPRFSARRFVKTLDFKDLAERERALASLRKAGLPDVEPVSVKKMKFPLPDRPSIAVLTFANMGGDPKQDYLGDGISENIITALSPVPGIFVIARNSTFTYKGKAVKVQRVAEEMGVRYVLEGSVQRAGEKVRITAQLIDALTGHHLWAQRYDRDMKNIFALQDEITMKIILALRGKLTGVGQSQLLGKGTGNLKAFLKTLQAHEYFYRLTKDDNVRARRMAEQAIALDPGFVWPYVRLGYTHLMDARFGWGKSRKHSIARAEELAQNALALDDSIPMARSLLGYVYFLKRQYKNAITEQERAIALNPNSDRGYYLRGLVQFFAGRPEKTIESIKKAIRLNPVASSFHLQILGAAYASTGRYEEAIAALKKALRRAHNRLFPHLGLAITYSLAGREEEARAAVAEILRLDPKFSLERVSRILSFKNQSDTDRFVDTLRKAGLPENPPLSLPTKPSIAVLPFANLSNDPEQEYFADDMTEDLITDLSKVSGLFVIARNSTFTYKGKAVKVKRVAEELGVRYVLEGSVRRAGGKVRINAQFIDAKSGDHLWVERYDRELKDIFGMQDEVMQKIVAALKVKLTQGERERLERQRTGNPETYDYVLRGREKVHLFTEESNDEARRMFEKATELDPEFAVAYAGLGEVYLHRWMFGWSRDPKVLERATELALRGRSLDERLPEPRKVLAHANLWRKKHGAAIAEARRVIALDPNDADGYAGLGVIMTWAGKPKETIGLVRRAMRLNPRYPPTYLWGLGHAQAMTGDFEKSIDSFKRLIAINPDFMPAYAYLAFMYTELDRMVDARRDMAEVGRISPAVTPHDMKKRLPYKDGAILDRVISAMSKTMK